MITEIEKELKTYSNPQKAKILQWFFKTWVWEYWYWDIFLWITVPTIRSISKKYNLSLTEINYFLSSPYHEFRSFGIISLVYKYQKLKNITDKKEIVDFYLSKTKYINNWDLVDVSCYKILGQYCYEIKNTKILYKLSKSSNLWEKRMSIVSMMYFIKQKEFSDAINIITSFLNDSNDLIAKAWGWMLREIWKQDEIILINYLKKYHTQMPRIMFSYSKERIKDSLKL